MPKLRKVHEPTTCSITDHALLRWLERVHGIDVEFFREQLLEETRDYIESGVTYAITNGVKYVFKNGKLITVVA